MVVAHHRDDVSSGELGDLLAALIAHRFLIFAAQRQDVLAAAARDEHLFALGQRLLMRPCQSWPASFLVARLLR